MEEKILFCQMCKQKLRAGIGELLSQDKNIQFEDGWYCPDCAKIKVDKLRAGDDTKTI